MIVIKKRRFIWVGSVVLGVILLGMPAVYAQDEQLVPEWVGSATEGGNSNAAVKGDLEALGDLSEDLVFTPVNPCRIVDTRYGGGGFISAGSKRHYKVYGNLAIQGGTTCNSPVGYPAAAHIQVIAVDPNGKGNVIAYPYGSSGTAGVAVNFNKIGTNLANAGTTKVNYGSGYDITIKSSFSGCHVLIMVLGYYTRPEATSLQAYSTYAHASVAQYALGVVYSPICKTGYVATGGGCSWQYDWNEIGTTSRPYPASGIPTRWECRGFHNRPGSQNLTTYVVCARMPGR